MVSKSETTAPYPRKKGGRKPLSVTEMGRGEVLEGAAPATGRIESP